MLFNISIDEDSKIQKRFMRIMNFSKKISIALQKIARETGEDEDYHITELKKIGIKILRHGFIFLGKYIKGFIHKKIDNPDRQKLENYNYQVDIGKIDEEIYRDLLQEHGINDSELSEEEWIEIKCSDLWKKCQKQVAREIIAKKIYSYLKLENSKSHEITRNITHLKNLFAV